MSSFSTGCAEVGTLSQAIAERESVKKPKNKNKKKKWIRFASPEKARRRLRGQAGAGW